MSLVQHKRTLYKLTAILTLCAGLCTSAGEPSTALAGFCPTPAAAQTTERRDALSGQRTAFAPVELIGQNPALPNGCEVTSLAMVLTAAGYPAGHVELYNNHLPQADITEENGVRHSASPEDAYIGDAAAAPGGWYCFEQPILQAGNSWIAENGGDARMQILRGTSRESLLAYAAAEIPVICWVTLDYATPNYFLDYTWMLPDGSEYTPYSNLHCVVVTGMENGFFRIADPLNGWQFVKKDVFWQSFAAMGQRAVAVVPSAAE